MRHACRDSWGPSRPQIHGQIATDVKTHIYSTRFAHSNSARRCRARCVPSGRRPRPSRRSCFRADSAPADRRIGSAHGVEGGHRATAIGQARACWPVVPDRELRGDELQPAAPCAGWRSTARGVPGSTRRAMRWGENTPAESDKDAAFILRAKAGNQGAFARLCDPNARSVVHRFVPDRPRAEELSQEISSSTRAGPI